MRHKHFSDGKRRFTHSYMGKQHKLVVVEDEVVEIGIVEIAHKVPRPSRVLRVNAIVATAKEARIDNRRIVFSFRLGGK